jgi:hypothetical protein
MFFERISFQFSSVNAEKHVWNYSSSDKFANSSLVSCLPFSFSSMDCFLKGVLFVMLNIPIRESLKNLNTS